MSEHFARHTEQYNYASSFTVTNLLRQQRFMALQVPFFFSSSLHVLGLFLKTAWRNSAGFIWFLLAVSLPRTWGPCSLGKQLNLLIRCQTVRCTGAKLAYKKLKLIPYKQKKRIYSCWSLYRHVTDGLVLVFVLVKKDLVFILVLASQGLVSVLDL